MSAEREAAEVLSAAIEAVLRGAGLTDKPGDYDDGIHSWRCSYPDRYGPCNCFAELVTDLAAALAAAAGGREAEAFLDSLPTDLFSQTEIKKLRDWADEWSAS